ncbi:MAG: GMP synthase [glutamine-hydrolyzing] subunit A [Methanonatronarchaeales archaeon]|nr:GMP synthase [glutamine-hydrolyzing] subunit A [Methanonatronarchaeales archaeon]
MIAVIDYGLGNLRSVRRGLERCGADVEVTRSPGRIKAADGLVLPGVGSFDDGMRNLEPLKEALLDAVDEGVPLMGVCLGMQMLLEYSEEGDEAGLGVIEGRSLKFRRGKVPHMGWNTLSELDHAVFDGVYDGSHAYFVHSYYAESPELRVAASSDYHGRFASAVARGSVVGVQFHPEKSGEVGLRVLKNFVEMV